MYLSVSQAHFQINLRNVILARHKADGAKSEPNLQLWSRSTLMGVSRLCTSAEAFVTDESSDVRFRRADESKADSVQ